LQNSELDIGASDDKRENREDVIDKLSDLQDTMYAQGMGF
jgi:hypothetical protein